MKATRRLGRGLGAFLDFGPAGADGTAFVSDAISAGTAPILQVSAPTPRPPSPVPVLQRRPALPAAVPAPVPAPPDAAVIDDSPFIDDLVVDLGFPDVELE